MTETIPLPRLPAALRELTNSDPPAYQRLWHLAVAGRFPISIVGSRYHVNRADLPEIAAMLGLTNTAGQPVPTESPTLDEMPLVQAEHPHAAPVPRASAGRSKPAEPAAA